jgi:hypothetical protein
MRAKFDELSLDERRAILVASDAKYEDIINQIDWRKVVLAAPRVVVPWLWGPAVLWFGIAAYTSAYLAGTFTSAAKRAGDRRSFWQRWFTKGDVPLPHLPPDEARRLFRFDVGGPEDGGVYIANPCVPGHYMPPAVADERLAQEKLAAFLRIASTLGAKKIDVKSGESVGTESGGDAKVALPAAAAQVGLNISFKSGNTFERQMVAEFGKPKTPPHVPEELRGWLDMEPTLRGMVQTRLQGEPSAISVNLHFGRMVDIGSKLTAKFASRGLEVGGSYHVVSDSRWGFDIEFWPKE